MTRDSHGWVMGLQGADRLAEVFCKYFVAIVGLGLSQAQKMIVP